MGIPQPIREAIVPSNSSESELDAARIVQHVTGQRLEPYDTCPECGDYHDTSAPSNGRYDFHQGENGALEVTRATSRAAERNERTWNPYLTPHPAPALRARWHLMVDSTARAKAPRSKKAARESREFLEQVSPALAELERRGVSHAWVESACPSSPWHDPDCPYGALGQAGVKSAYTESTSGGAGSICVSVLFGYDDMPAFDEEDERKKKARRQRKQQAKAGKKPVPAAGPDASGMGLVQWSFNPAFIARLESRRDEDVHQEAERMRSLFGDRLPASEILERAREVVDEKITLAKTMTWRERLPSQPGPRTADAGTELVDLLEAEFSLYPDLAAKLRRAHAHRTRREVFFWLAWPRSSAWRRLTRHAALPARTPELPDGVTGVWVGCLTDRTQILYGDTAGWIRHSLTGFLPASICQRNSP